MMVEKQAHLSDLFKTGQQVTFKGEHDGKEIEVSVYLRKPVSSQHEQAVSKARAAAARVKAKYRDKESDEYVSLIDELAPLDTKDLLIEQIMKFEDGTLRSQAYNEVLYDENFAAKDEDGKMVWGEQGEEYIELLSAMTDRMAELQASNAKLAEEDADLAIKFEDDDELMKMEESRAVFDGGVDVRIEALTNEKLKEFTPKRFVDLHKLLMKKLIDLDSTMIWHETYRKWMLFYTCKMPDDRTKRYFKDFDQIDLLPTHITQDLYDKLDQIDVDIDDVKNSLSLQPS
jgi:hypothetical protein